MQQDIRLFSGKKAKIAQNKMQKKAREQPIQKRRKVVKKVKEPMRAAGLETGSSGRTEPEEQKELELERSAGESSEVRSYLQVYSYKFSLLSNQNHTQHTKQYEYIF